MRRSQLVAVAILLTLGVLSAQAVIKALTPLKTILTASKHICVARVDALLPARPALVLTVDGDLKGKMPLRRLPINMKGDKFALADDHSGKMFKRLAKDTFVLLFVQDRAEGLVVFGYTNGTWFQMLGQKDGEDHRWSFLHCETYFRRTFKGTTAELQQVVKDYLDRKKDPPAPNEDEKPGYGPEVNEKKGRLPLRSGGPLFGVIVGLPAGGVIGFLALLFPAVFGGVAILMRRWAALMTIVFTNSTLLTLFLWKEEAISGSWWGTRTALWVVLGGLTVLGLLWAWGRHLRTFAPDSQATPVPPRTERWTLLIISLLCLGSLIAFWMLNDTPPLRHPVLIFLLIMSAGFWTGTFYALAMQWRHGDPAARNLLVPTEGLILAVMAVAGIALTTRESGARLEGSKELASAAEGEGTGPRLRRQVWSFQPPDQTQVAATPVVAGERVYAGIIVDDVFAIDEKNRRLGRLYCLDRATGKELWARPFGDRDTTGGEPMKQMLCAPFVVDGRLYVGEGFHDNNECRLFCLDAATGKKYWDFNTASKEENDLWPFPTNSHVESSPAVADGRVFFGAGDKGLYCLDAASGKKLWQYPKPGDRRTGLHVDASPVVVGNRVFCCSGKSRTFGRLTVFCVDVATGQKCWEIETDLPAWGSPTVQNGQVFVGLGNARIGEKAPNPRGAVLCLDAFDGRRLWRHDTNGTVHGRCVSDGKRVFVGCQDHVCYALDCRDGRPAWKRPLSGEVESSPALARGAWTDGPAALYVASVNGDVYCLDPATGKVFWHHDELTHGGPDKKGFNATLISGLAVEVRRTKQGDERRLWFAARVESKGESNAILYCLEDEWADAEK